MKRLCSVPRSPVLLLSILTAASLVFQGCYPGGRVAVFADPYGPSAFPAMEDQARTAAAEAGFELDWIELPVQAELAVFDSLLAPGVTYQGIFLADLYEPAVAEALKKRTEILMLWGYGPASGPGSALGWSPDRALEIIIGHIYSEESLLKRDKPILFTAVLGPEGTDGGQEALLRRLWPSDLDPQKLWIYRLANPLDRGAALQAANQILAQKADMVYLDAGRMSPAVYQALAGAGVRLAVVDWKASGLSYSRAKFALERDWKIFWEAAVSSLKDRDPQVKNVPLSLVSDFSKENTLLESFHIR